MKNAFALFFLVVLVFSFSVTIVQAESFGSDCTFVTTQTSDSSYHLDLVNNLTGELEALCSVVTYRLENYGDSTAKFTGMTEFSLDVSFSPGDSFTVYVEKDGEAINGYYEIEGGVTDTTEITEATEVIVDEETTVCMNSVIDLSGRYSIELLGSDGNRNADCRFTEYGYEVLSGEAVMIGMNEYTLFFDGTKVGTIQITTTSPSYYSAQFVIGSEIETETTFPAKLPPAGYEDEVITVFTDYDNPFPDTDITASEGQAAAELYRRAVIGGYPDGEFKGSQEVNRAETAKFLLYARYGTVDELENNGTFADVLDGEWYTKFVVEAANKGIINGYPGGLFRPANNVNTAEFLKMLTLTFEITENLPYTYLDVDSDDWFAKYAGTAEKYSLFPDRDMYLYPASNLTREEIAVAIYQYLANR